MSTPLTTKYQTTTFLWCPNLRAISQVDLYLLTWLELPVQLLCQALTDEIKASTTVNQSMDPISQGTARKAHLKKKQ